MIDNFKFVAKVIASCKTEQQLETCTNWIGKVNLGCHYLDKYFYYLELKKYIQEQRIYINLLKEIEA